METVDGEVAGAEKGFRVSDPLLRQVFRYTIGEEGEIVILPQEAVLPDPGLDEVGKILILKLRCERGDAPNFGGSAVFLDQLPKTVERDGALQMKMELDLGEPSEDVDVDFVAHPFPPVVSFFIIRLPRFAECGGFAGG